MRHIGLHPSILPVLVGDRALSIGGRTEANAIALAVFDKQRAEGLRGAHVEGLSALSRWDEYWQDFCEVGRVIDAEQRKDKAA